MSPPVSSSCHPSIVASVDQGQLAIDDDDDEEDDAVADDTDDDDDGNNDTDKGRSRKAQSRKRS